VAILASLITLARIIYAAERQLPRRASDGRSGSGDFKPPRMECDRDQSPAQGSGQSQRDNKTSEDKTGGPGSDRDNGGKDTDEDRISKNERDGLT
jgi:hypothetical protein